MPETTFTDRSDADDATFAAEVLERFGEPVPGRELREALARCIASKLVTRRPMTEIAEALLAGPLADLVAQRDEAQAKVARVADLATEWATTQAAWVQRDRVVGRIRAALGGDS